MLPRAIMLSGLVTEMCVGLATGNSIVWLCAIVLAIGLGYLFGRSKR